MTTRQNVYGEIDNKTDLHEVFLAIRKDVDEASVHILGNAARAGPSAGPARHGR